MRDPVGKALQVIWSFVDSSEEAQARERGVRDLSLELRLPAATVYRTLTSLLRHGLVQRNRESGQYCIGMELYRVALQVAGCFSIRNAALPVMQDLVATCNEAAFLTLYDRFRMEMMFAAAVYPTHQLRYIVPLNEWVPVHAGASGLAIMAFLPKDECQQIIERTRLAPLTNRTITDPSLLKVELMRIREQGYAFSRGQRNIGAVAVAAPLWGPNGQVLGDLVLSIPEPRFQTRMEMKLARLVIAHAKRIIGEIGGRPPDPLGCQRSRRRRL